MSKALGRGLEAIIPGWTNDQQSLNKDFEKIENIPIDLIEPSQNQPRVQFDDDTLIELSESIKERGILQPIIVIRNNDKYIIIAGERRYRAAKIAGLQKVPAVIRTYEEAERFEIALLENIQREDLNVIEQAQAYNYLMTKLNLNQEQLSLKIKKKRSSVANTLRLLALPYEIQKEIEQGAVSAGQARALLSLPANKERFEMIKKIKEDGLSVRSLEQIVKEKKKPYKKINMSYKEAEIIELEEKLMHIFGSKVEVTVKGKGKEIKGNIKIKFGNLEDLERIIEIINK
ncbi:ParB/RepB/Spo0J family partition protein [bacterium]